MERNKSTLETWDKLADAYQEKFMELDMYNASYDSFCDKIEKKDALVLEIGCGPGNITRYILAKRPDLKIEGLDTSPNMIELAKKNNPSADFMVMDCRDIDTVTKKYDAIVCGFCMPYLSKKECIKLIADCAKLMHKNGVLYLSFIENDYNKSAFETSSNGEHTVFVYYHNQDYLRDALKETDLLLAHEETLIYDKASGPSKHTIFIARKN